MMLSKHTSFTYSIRALQGEDFLAKIFSVTKFEKIVNKPPLQTLQLVTKVLVEVLTDVHRTKKL